MEQSEVSILCQELDILFMCLCLFHVYGQTPSPSVMIHCMNVSYSKIIKQFEELTVFLLEQSLTAGVTSHVVDVDSQNNSFMYDTFLK